MKINQTRQTFLKSLPLLALAGCLFATGALATSIFSTNAELWFSKFCLAGTKGINAAVCDLRERVIGLESSPAPVIPKTLIIRDAAGEYVGALTSGMNSGGIVYNEILNSFFTYETNLTRYLGEGIGEPRMVVFQSTDCSGQIYAEDVQTDEDNPIYWAPSKTDAETRYLYNGDGSDSAFFLAGSSFQPGHVGCLLGGGGSATTYYPVTASSWAETLKGPFTVSLE